MSNAKSFHLRWNNHLSNLRTLLEFLYNEQSFVDVTLSCSDGMLRAHKLVLSACSPYFDTIFRENPCKHPTVILKGVSLREMQLIIEYMYVGSVDVPEDDLHSLLNTASELHIKGLVQSKMESTDDDNQYNSSVSFADINKQCSPTIKAENDEPSYSDCNEYGKRNENNDLIRNERNTNDEYPHQNGSNDEDMVCRIIDIAQVKMESSDNTVEESNMVENGIDNDNYRMVGHIESETTMICKVCSRTFINKQNMKRHMQTHSGEKPHRCQLCDMSFLRLSHLQRHHRTHTGERPFACNQCDKQFSRSDKLKQHVIIHHSDFIPVKQQKQRGRPRKTLPGPSAETDFIVGIPEQGSSRDFDENCENTVPSFHALQHVYNLQSSVNCVPVGQ